MVLSKEKVNEFIQKYILLLPIMFAIAVIPLIVRITYYDPGLSGYSWFSDNDYLMDMFMYHKNRAMMILDGVLAVGFVYLAIRRQLRKEMALLPLGLYFILVVFSTIASVAPHQTWNGFYGMLESAYAVFGYCMICYYAFAVIRTEKQLKLVMYAFGVSVLIMGAVAVSQFVGLDFYMSDLGKDLIFPAKYAGYKEGLTLALGEGRVYASLFNPNYVGVYACILFPLLFVLAFSERKKWHTIVYMVLIVLTLVCLVGAKSKTAVIIIAVCTILASICFGRMYWKSIIPVLTASVLVFIGLNMLQGENSAFSNTVERVTAVVEKAEYELTDITLNDENYTITYKEKVLTVTYNKNEEGFWTIEVLDENGKAVPTVINETNDGYYLDDSAYEGLEFIFGADDSMNVGFSVVVENNRFFIYYSETEKSYFYTNYYGRATKLYSSETYDSPVFKLMGGFSGRGYIWSKTIPVLKETLIFGSGPDTYAFMFPQYDYVSLLQNGWENKLITKPHSMYLQMGVQTGVLSLIAFLVLNVWYIIRSIKLYFNRKLVTFTERCGVAIFVGVICFLMAGMLHDSTIGVSIIYWTLLGMGFACNKNIENNKSKIN